MRMRSSLVASVAVFVVAFVLLPAALLAEDVYLKNGRVFRGVIAHVEGGLVHIEMPGGTLSFPESSVLRIEASTAAYREYQNRRQTLQSGTVMAGDWLDLARWAKSQGLEPAAREAALAAGRLDPAAPGVRSFLAELGYVFDAASASFLPLEESMARKGLVYDGGAWIPAAEREARRARERAEEMARMTSPAEPRGEERARQESVEPDGVVGIPLVYAGVYGVAGPTWGPYAPGRIRPHRPGSSGGHHGCNACSPPPPSTAPPPPAPPPASASTRRGQPAPVQLTLGPVLIRPAGSVH